MQASLAKLRHFILITLIFSLLFFVTYFNKTPQVTVGKTLDEQRLLKTIKKESTVCDSVDIQWLASDRKYWDGWTDKSMFIKPDGTFTQSNIYVSEGEEICIVVLLGPTPAKSSIKPEEHVGPEDSIVMFANGESTKINIRLEQHQRQTNAYFAAVKFTQPDTYRLRATNEYRSYFWESPIYHSYRPSHFRSQNKLIVKEKKTPKPVLPPCSFGNMSVTGSWRNAQLFEKSNPAEYYNMFENTQGEFIENERVFVPDQCHLEYKSNGQGVQCLGKKTIHVWGDANIARNLKALSRGSNWCNINEINKITNKKKKQEAMRCLCNDEESSIMYPWLQNASIPLTIGNSFEVDTRIYYNNIGSISFSNMAPFIKKNKHQEYPADVVILSLGNSDIREIRVSPKEFASSFKKLLTTLRHDVYPNQKIIVRTPQYFCCGVIWGTSWNSGRSLAFSMAVREVVESLEGVLLWDVHSIGNDDTTCMESGTSYSKRNVINLENQILWNLVCTN
ncbi:hypothetical protein K501DRAFT_253451 [Backusella circina FSU 941]|nr:hypothetical protein K501DRAFT_253451 [Backusella circina FSU 941]